MKRIIIDERELKGMDWDIVTEDKIYKNKGSIIVKDEGKERATYLYKQENKLYIIENIESFNGRILEIELKEITREDIIY